MFTGLIQETGKVISIDTKSNSLLLTILANKVLNDLKIGDSIAIDGACQTVIEFTQNSFKVFVSFETLNVTNFRELKQGSIVNLERTLRLCDRLDGHIVSGHVDGIAQLIKRNTIGETTDFFFRIPKQFANQVVKKGSIAINGISLTIAEIIDDVIKIAVIPHTIKNTNLYDLKIGANVNFETDIMAKYIEKYLSSKHNSSNIDLSLLERNGFL